MKMIEEFQAARRAMAPLVAIRTPDPASTTKALTTVFGEFPIAKWDIIRGLEAVTQKATDAVNKANQGQAPELVTSNPIEALRGALAHIPQFGIVYFHNAHLYVEQGPSDAHKPVIQAIWNMRDGFKKLQRTLVLLCPEIKLPIELKNDVLVIKQGLPTNKELATIVARSLAGQGLKKPGKKMMPKLIDAVSGLSEFSAEQVVAMSVIPGKKRVDMESVWRGKIEIIEQEKGLKIFRNGPIFADIGGHDHAKRLLHNTAKGKRCPTMIVWLDEVEKSFHAVGTDTSGTTTDQFKVLLTSVQDNDWDMCLLYGFPGTGKSLLCKAFGQEIKRLTNHECQTVQADLGAMKHIWVGSSEARMRAFISVVEGMSQGGHVLFMCTCNAVDMLRQELMRRFIWKIFCDFPNRKGKDETWEINAKRYKIPSNTPRPNDENWTGADIWQCNMIADQFGISLKDAAEFITPIYYSMAEQVEKMRTAASGKYLDADKPGPYLYKQEPQGFLASYGLAKRGKTK